MGKLQVLYVDDEPDIREIAGFALGLDPELEVRSAPSGIEALALLGEGTWRPDAVLLDVMMPGLDGPGTLDALRRLYGYETAPVVFIPARAQTEEQSRFLALGAVGVITKPFNPMTLASDFRALVASG